MIKLRSTLSLFNGIGIGAQALKNIGVEVGTSYVSEIDKFANETNDKNHPESIQLGSVTQWAFWGIDWAEVDLVTAGFPCQAWSLAGQQLGDRDPRGALFWVTLDIISHVLKHNPNAKWLMENVRMKKEFEDYITHHTTKALGDVKKVLINSALLTAQNRRRFYWSNFDIDQPEDRGLVLGDVLEDGVVDREKSHCIDANYHKGGNLKSYFEKHRRQLVFEERPCELLDSPTEGGHVANATDIKGHESIKRVYSPDGKAPTLTTMQGGHRQPKVLCGAVRGRYNPVGKVVQQFELRKDEKTSALTTVQKDNVLRIEQRGRGFNKGGHYYDKSPTMTAHSFEYNNHVTDGVTYRKLTPTECERLQGYPDGYTEGVSNTQRYKQCGNGWTLPVIEHIFSEAYKE